MYDNEKMCKRLEEHLDHVEKQLDDVSARSLRSEIALEHVQANSDERLGMINGRFDQVNSRISEIKDAMDQNNERDRWLGNLVVGALIIFGSLVFTLWMQPVAERIVTLQEKVNEIEYRRAFPDNDSKP